MKQKLLGRVILLTILLLPVGQLYVMAENQAGNGAVYLQEGVNARYLAMGNAGTASVNDSSAVYWNPAAINQLQTGGLTAQTALLDMGRSWHFLGYAYPLHKESGRDFGFGFSWISYSAGSDLEQRESNRLEPDAIFSDQQTAIVGSYSDDFGSDFNIGISGKILMHRLDDTNGNGFSLDLSVWQPATEEITWGLVIQDLFGSIKWTTGHKDELPLIIRPGVNWAFFEKQLNVALDSGIFYDQRTGSINHLAYHMGVEYMVSPVFATRIGINDNQLTAGLGGFITLGDMASIRLDYAFAWERQEAAGYTHLFSMNIMINQMNLKQSGFKR